jgi:hypothetical protein
MSVHVVPENEKGQQMLAFFIASDERYFNAARAAL